MTLGREASRGQLCNEGGMTSGLTWEGSHKWRASPVRTRWSMAHSLLTSPFPLITRLVSPTDCGKMRRVHLFPEELPKRGEENFSCPFPLSLPLKESW